MKIIVCIKQVPNTTEIKIDPVTNTLKRDGVPSIINPDDKAAIEAAYQEGQAKLKGNGKSVPPLAAIKNPLRDGDLERPDDPAYAGAYFVNANNQTD